MLFRNSLYIIENSTLTENRIVATLFFNSGHEVFEGHFPGNPVTPGVILMAIVQELLELNLNIKLNLRKISSSKFLQLTSPGNNDRFTFDLRIHFDRNTIKVKTTGTISDKDFFRMESEYFQS